MNNASALPEEIKLCLDSGGFNMRKWNSNSESLLRSLKQDPAFSGDFTETSGKGVVHEFMHSMKNKI